MRTHYVNFSNPRARRANTAHEVSRATASMTTVVLVATALSRVLMGLRGQMDPTVHSAMALVVAGCATVLVGCAVLAAATWRYRD